MVYDYFVTSAMALAEKIHTVILRFWKLEQFVLVCENAEYNTEEKSPFKIDITTVFHMNFIWAHSA